MHKNTKRGIIIAVFAFLAVLFVSTIGSSLTGFAVIGKKPTLSEYPYPFIKNSVCNGVAFVLTDRYDHATYRAALAIERSLKAETRNLIKQTTCAKRYTRQNIPDGEFNLIVIGNPCTNGMVADALKAKSCSIESIGLKEGEALIQIINHRRTSTLVIAGDAEKAAKVLADYRLYPLKGEKVIVSGTGNSLRLKYVKTESPATGRSFVNRNY